MALGLTTVRAEIVTDNTGQKLHLPVVIGPGGAVFRPVVEYQKLNLPMPKGRGFWQVH